MTATALPTDEITAPGVYELDNDAYHADRAWLGSTGARKLLPPSCPALFKWEQDNPREPSKALDLGTIAHNELLGYGPGVAVVPDNITASNGAWSTTEAKAFVAAARKQGRVPIKPDDYAEVQAMVAAVRAHPIAGKLFTPGTGTPEASLFWIDDVTGVQRKARLDWLPHLTGRRTIVADLKTTVCAATEKFARSAMDLGYHQQAAYYLDAVRALDLGNDPQFVFVAIEKKPPYLVNVVQLDVTALRIGTYLNRKALALYKTCTDTGEWPGYSRDVELASLPAFYERQFEHEDI